MGLGTSCAGACTVRKVLSAAAHEMGIAFGMLKGGTARAGPLGAAAFNAATGMVDVMRNDCPTHLFLPGPFMKWMSIPMRRGPAAETGRCTIQQEYRCPSHGPTSAMK